MSAQTQIAARDFMLTETAKAESVQLRLIITEPGVETVETPEPARKSILVSRRRRRARLAGRY